MSIDQQYTSACGAPPMINCTTSYKKNKHGSKFFSPLLLSELMHAIDECSEMLWVHIGIDTMPKVSYPPLTTKAFHHLFNNSSNVLLRSIQSAGV